MKELHVYYVLLTWSRCCRTPTAGVVRAAITGPIRRAGNGISATFRARRVLAGTFPAGANWPNACSFLAELYIHLDPERVRDALQIIEVDRLPGAQAHGQPLIVGIEQSGQLGLFDHFAAHVRAYLCGDSLRECAAGG